MEQRRWGLDFVRAVAILTVIEGHGRHISPQLGSYLSYLGLTDGVELFFVLSGFLIGTIVIKSYHELNHLDLHTFWMRRWLRTLPIFYVALGVNILAMVLVLRYEFSLYDMLAHVVFVQNMVPPYEDHRFFSEAWSLAIEEHFYLGFPLLVGVGTLCAKPRDGKKLFLIVLGVMSGIAIGFRLVTFLAMPEHPYALHAWNTRFRIIVPARLDALAVGVFGAYLRAFHTHLWTNPLVVRSAGITGVVGMLFLDRTWIFKGVIGVGFFACVPYFFLYALAVMLTLPFFDAWQPRGNRLTRLVTFTSQLSYSMYLFHNSLLAIPLTRYTQTLASEPGKIALYVVYWVSVYGIAFVTYHAIEKPVLRFRDRRYQAQPGVPRGERDTPTLLQSRLS